MQVVRLRGILFRVCDQSHTKEISRNVSLISLDEQFPISVFFVGGETVKLKDHHEIVGLLEKYTLEPDCIRCLFRIEQVVELPKGAIPIQELDDCINRKIGIFNNQGEYRLRKCPKPVDNFKEENCPICEKRNTCSKEGRELFYCLLEKVSEMSRRK